MASAFGYGLAYTIVKSIRDYNKENEKQKEKLAEFYQKCNQEIADAATEMYNLIRMVSTQANLNYIPIELKQGDDTLPFYAFFKVIQAQEGNPSSEQLILLDFFINEINPEFTKNEFLSAVHSNNQTRQKIEELVGMTENKVGSFWSMFFKLVKKTDNEEEAIIKIANYFATIVMHFCVLGKPDSQVALPICESFASLLQDQFTKSQSQPKADLDFYGEAEFLDHYQNMKKLSKDLVYAAGLQNSIDVDLFFKFFCTGIILELTRRVNHNRLDMGDMVDYSLKLCGIDIDLSGYEVVDQAENDGDFADMLNKLTTVRPDLQSFWSIVLYAGQETDRNGESVTFTKECIGFLMGIESELKRKYSLSVSGSLAADYMTGITANIANLFS